VKNVVYEVKINDLKHLQARIRDAVATATPNMLQATWNEVNIVWIFVVPSRENLLRKLYTKKKTLVVSLCNGVTHRCV
jgi:hypothetical protein